MNFYGYGTSEEIVSRAIRKYSTRKEIVLATTVYFKMHEGTGGTGLSRKAIMEKIDTSLLRLCTDYVALRDPRLRPGHPVDEATETMHDVKAGKGRYIGASSLRA